ncbi:MAG: hypothetical protein R2873_22565 [Caldilineaceae bacterium]
MFFLSYGTAQAAPSRQVVAPPQPVADTITIEEDTPTTIDVLANDGLGGGTALILAAVSNPPAGTAVIVDNKVLTPPMRISAVSTAFFTSSTMAISSTRLASVRVTVTAVDDGPSDILLSNATVAEDAQIGQVVGALNAEGDSEAGTSGSLDRSTFSLVGSDNDNDKFRIVLTELLVDGALDFETKANLVIDVQVRNLQGQTFTKRFTIQVTNANDAPHAIDLSNNRIDENQQPGVTVGTLSSQDVDAGDTHAYALVDGAGSADNDLFRIEDNVLRTNALLDFETKPIYSVRIASTDNRGGAFAQIFLVNVNNLPSPPDAVANSLQSCTGDPITLVNQGAGITRVLVRIENITISDNTSDGCTVSGAMTITTNGSTVSSIPFSGVVNARISSAILPSRISRLTWPVCRWWRAVWRSPTSTRTLPSTSSARCCKCLRSLAASPIR